MLCTLLKCLHQLRVSCSRQSKNLGVMDSIHQRAVLFLEKRDIIVRVKMKHDSISMEEFPEIRKEPMGGESTKGDK